MRLGRKPSSLTPAWAQRQRVVLISLIGLNVGVFVAQLFLESYQTGFVQEFLGLSAVGIQNAYAWQFFTASFLHLGPLHLIADLAVLYLFGRDVESIMGQRHFLWLYLAGSFAGELTHLFLMPADAVLYGSSGGVIAVLLAYATILPELELTGGFFFFIPGRMKAKYLAYAISGFGVFLLLTQREGVVMHSGMLGGALAGWLYAHLLGFGRPSFLQLALHQRRLRVERYQQMSAEEFIAEQVDPLLEKIARRGLSSLTRRERRILAQAREKLVSSR